VRRLLTGLFVLIATAVLAVSGYAAQPIVPTTPSVGKPTTRFTISFPARYLHGTSLSQLQISVDAPKGRPRSCGEPWTNPKPRVAGGRVSLVLDPHKFGTLGHWCRGTWKVSVYSEDVNDDNEDTGTGGVFQTDVARSKFTVR
jgi:hypothetical protein